MAEAKSIYGDGHVGHKYVTPSAENDDKVRDFKHLFSEIYFSQPFRNSPMVLAEAKSIYGDGHVGQKHVVPSAGDNDEKVTIDQNFSPCFELTLHFYPYFSHLEMLQWFWLKLKQSMAMDTQAVNMLQMLWIWTRQ